MGRFINCEKVNTIYEWLLNINGKKYKISEYCNRNGELEITVRNDETRERIKDEKEVDLVKAVFYEATDGDLKEEVVK